MTGERLSLTIDSEQGKLYAMLDVFLRKLVTIVLVASRMTRTTFFATHMSCG